jgi:hypothetical protein
MTSAEAIEEARAALLPPEQGGLPFASRFRPMFEHLLAELDRRSGPAPETREQLVDRLNGFALTNGALVGSPARIGAVVDLIAFALKGPA